MRRAGWEPEPWSWDAALTGVIPPLISPLDASGDPDPDALERLVRRVLDGGCSGLFVLGGCGEGAWLTTAQRSAVVRATARVAAGRVPVLAGVVLPATGPAVAAATEAAAEGADAVVVGSPYYFDVDGPAQRRHVEAVLAAVRIPALLYNIPQCTHHTLSPEVVEALAHDHRVLGIKDSAGDFGVFQRFLRVKHHRSTFRVLQGSEHLAAASLLLGGDGLVPGLANVAPRLLVALSEAARRGDAGACARLQAEVEDLATLYERGHWLPALKAACAAVGVGDGMPAAPLARAGDADRSAVEAILRRHRLIPSAAPSAAPLTTVSAAD